MRIASLQPSQPCFGEKLKVKISGEALQFIAFIDVVKGMMLNVKSKEMIQIITEASPQKEGEGTATFDYGTQTHVKDYLSEELNKRGVQFEILA